MDEHAAAPEPATAPESPRSIDDIATQAIEVAERRAADRAAGKDVPRELPRYVGRPGEARGFSADADQPEPRPAVDAARGDAGAAAAPAPAETPSGWPDERRASFGRLPPEAQRIVLEHARSQDEDYGRKSRDLVAQARHAEPFIRAYVDNHEFMDAQSERVGVKPHEIIQNTVRLLQALTTGTPQQRMQALSYVAHVAGIDPRSLGA